MRPVRTTPAVPVAKFTSGVVDNSGKFATSVVDTGVVIQVVHLDLTFVKAWVAMATISKRSETKLRY